MRKKLWKEYINSYGIDKSLALCHGRNKLNKEQKIQFDLDSYEREKDYQELLAEDYHKLP